MTRDEQAQKKLENQLKRTEETALLCTEFLLTNASDKELEAKTGISSSTVGRRLIDKNYVMQAYDLIIDRLLEAGCDENELPKSNIELFELIAKRRQENLLRGKAKGGQTTLSKYAYSKSENGKFEGSENLDVKSISSKVNTQYKFIGLAALHFRLHLDTLSDLFKITEDDLLNNISSSFTESIAKNKALYYLFNIDKTDQILAREEFIKYYSLLNYAISHNNIELKNKLIKELKDEKALSLKKERKSGDPLSSEDIETILKYQLKYALSANDACYIFDVNRSNYMKRMQNFLEDNQELKQQYEVLADYNSSLYMNGGRRG